MMSTKSGHASVVTSQATPVPPIMRPPDKRPMKSRPIRFLVPGIPREGNAETIQQASAGTANERLDPKRKRLQTIPSTKPSGTSRTNCPPPGDPIGAPRRRNATRQGNSIHGSR